MKLISVTMLPMENGILCWQRLKEMLSSTLVVRNPIQMSLTILFSEDVHSSMVCFGPTEFYNFKSKTVQ